MTAAIGKEGLMSVLVSPHLSEKATRLADKSRQFVFRVRTDASKPVIQRAVELMFDVKVTDVQVVNVIGKKKRFGSMHGRRQHWKKAYVTLAEGQDIEFLGKE